MVSIEYTIVWGRAKRQRGKEACGRRTFGHSSVTAQGTFLAHHAAAVMPSAGWCSIGAVGETVMGACPTLNTDLFKTV